jgi:hypothetical protein
VFSVFGGLAVPKNAVVRHELETRHAGATVTRTSSSS